MTDKKRILVIDDNEFILHYIQTIIGETQKYQISLARSGKEALQIISEGSFDLIICDIIMPEMDGIEFIRNLKQLDKETPIIAISGGMSGEDGKNFTDLASYYADDILDKPFGKLELLSSVELAINQTKVDIYELL